MICYVIAIPVCLTLISVTVGDQVVLVVTNHCNNLSSLIIPWKQKLNFGQCIELPIQLIDLFLNLRLSSAYF